MQKIILTKEKSDKVVEKKVIDDDDDKYLINEFQFQN